MTESLRVLLALELIGLAALPLAQLALSRLALGGAAFAKPLGFLLLGWLVWMGTVLGLRNDLWLAIGACGVLAAAGLAALLALRRSGRAIPWRTVLAFELLFIAAFAACALFNAYSPDVFETEKPMDMALINATIAADGYPPHDPWMAGEDIDYYYLGHFAIGVLIRLTDVEPSAGYNLALAAVFAMAAVTGSGLAAALAREAGARAWLAGACAAVLLVLAGTPGGGVEAIQQGDWASFRWFRESRVIEGTINDFPFFSFLLGDLHAHVIAGPLGLLALAFAVQVAVHGPPRGLAFFERALTALAIGTLYAVNSWSFPVCAGLLVLALALHARAEGRWRAAIGHAVLVLAAGVAAIVPFLLDVKSGASGVGIVDRREGLGDFLLHHGILYGTFAWVFLALYVGRARGAKHPLRAIVFSLTAGIVALPLLAEIDLAGAGAFALLLVVALHAMWSRGLPAPERAIWLLLAGALICLLLPELIYIRDEFDDSDRFRMNTVFKMGYIAWYLMAIAAACVIALSARWLPRLPRWAWAAVTVGIVATSLAFTVVGSYSRKSSFRGPATLDGRTWMTGGDVAAVDWLRANADGDAVIAEAVGDDYSEFGHARISTFTGRPAVLGWEGHEVQWKHDPGTRRDDIRMLFTSRNPRIVSDLLAKLRVEYVVLGQLERTDYGDARALTVLGRKVFERGGTEIYAYDPPPAPEPSATPAPAPTATPPPPVLGGG